MNGSLGQRVAGSKLHAPGPTIGFFTLMAIFVLSGAVMVYWGRSFHGKFGSAVGTVVEAGTDKPVVAAKVRLKGVFPATHPKAHGEITIARDSVTDQDGRFVLAETVAGPFDLTITHPGFAPLTTRVEIGVAEHKDLGKLALTKQP